jgi:hypothetical protein
VEELPLIAPLPPDTEAASSPSDQTIKQSFKLEPSLNLDLGSTFQKELR